MHSHPAAAENSDLMSDLWQRSSFDCRKPLWKVLQAGALCAVDLREGEAPPARLFLPCAGGCGAPSLAMLQKKPILGGV